MAWLVVEDKLVSFVRFCAVFLALAAFPVQGADTPPEISLLAKQLFMTGDGTKRFPSKPARDLMSPANFEAYQKALDELKCERALTFLNEGFRQAYPQFAHVKLIPGCMTDRGCRPWKMYATVEFEEYGYCISLSQLETANTAIAKRGGPPIPKYSYTPYPGKLTYTDVLAKERDEALSIMANQSDLGYLPPLLKIAELVETGAVFDVGADVEYYILRRACAMGADCSALEMRLRALEKSLTEVQLVRLDRLAREKIGNRPRLNELLYGKPVPASDSEVE